MLDYQITDFWKWFGENSNRLDSANFDRDLIKELDDTVKNWGLTWEIGPGLIKEHSLTISPNGNKNLLDQTNYIIDKAPMFDDWEFYGSKQAKENWGKAKLIDRGFEFEATNWTYVLLKYPDDKIEIMVKADNLKSLDTNSKAIAVDLVLTNLLGEERKMSEIDFVDIVNEFDKGYGITEIQFLPDHLSKMKRGV
jgi:hypothetical protein